MLAPPRQETTHGAVGPSPDEVRPRRVADPACLVQHRRRSARSRRPRTCTRPRSARSGRTTSPRSSRWRSSARRSSAEREIEIPEPVRDAYRLYRPSPLYRAHRLERALDTPAHIYYKYEGGSPAGSHKPNTALAQAFYNKEQGVTRLATETGAGQWGSALAFAGAYFGLEVKVYMVRASYDQKPYRRILMETYGAEVVASPSPTTNYGRSVLAATPDSPGSLGMAISEAVEDAATREDTKYALGSVLNHVLLHQTVIGQEAIEQMGMAGESPDVIIGCTGGGSNFAGLTFPFLGPQLPRRREVPDHRRRARGGPEPDPRRVRLRLRRHRARWRRSSRCTRSATTSSPSRSTPAASATTACRRWSACSRSTTSIEARSVHQRASFEAGVQFARAEGILPAPEPTHAIRVAIDEALEAREAGEARVILFNLCGHGHFDLSAYERYLDGTLEDYEYPRERVEAALASLPRV